MLTFRRPVSHPPDLTTAERKVLEHTIAGNSTKQVAYIMKTAPSTIQFHQRNIRAKARTHTLLAATVKYIQRGQL